jgi:hypothetical protein
VKDFRKQREDLINKMLIVRVIKICKRKKKNNPIFRARTLIKKEIVG